MTDAKKENIKNLCKQLFCEIVGSMLIAIGIYNFAVNAKFPMTGFSGISLILYDWIHCPIGVSTVVMNLPLMFLSYKILGKKFFWHSVRCTMISSLLIDYVAPLFPTYEGSRLLAALCTGVFAGLGYAMIYMVNSSTGGVDFIIMIVKAYRPHFPLGKISFALDAVVTLLGGLYFKEVDGLILNARGGYKQDERDVVMCACSTKEMYLVQQAVKKVDPKSFMIVLESNEVHGEGFHTIRVGEKVS